MRSRIRNSSRTPVSSSPASCPATSSHGTGVLSTIDPATDDRTSLPSGASLTCHLLCEPDERAADRHVRRGDRRLAERLRHLRVILAELDARDDRLSIDGTQPLERRLVALERLAADGLFDRRRAV